MKNFLTTAIIFCLMIFSGQVQAEEAEAKIDYGNSKNFSREEMDFCIEFIKDNLKRSGCTLHTVRYAGDKFNSLEQSV